MSDKDLVERLWSEAAYVKPLSKGTYEALTDAADALEAVTRERDSAVAAIERVRALHRKETRRSGWEVCTHCEIGMMQDPVDWPCDTIVALDGAPEPE